MGLQYLTSQKIILKRWIYGNDIGNKRLKIKTFTRCSLQIDIL